MERKITQQEAEKPKISLSGKSEILAQGAEAKIILENGIIIKDRISKSYRHPELDKKIRKQRTKSEIKLLEKASKLICSPVPQKSKEFDRIIMPYIKGKKLSEHLDDFQLKEQKAICREIGNAVANLHKNDIIHGDLTTSNMILVENTHKKFKKQLIELKKLNLPRGKYALFGSAPMGIRGIRQCKDIDVVVDESLWQEYKNKPEWKYQTTKNGVEHLSKGIIEFWHNWLPWYKNVNKFIKNAEVIEGLPFVQLKYIIEWKKLFGREKDKKDLQLIEQYQSENKKNIFFIDFGLGYISD